MCGVWRLDVNLILPFAKVVTLNTSFHFFWPSVSCTYSEDNNTNYRMFEHRVQSFMWKFDTVGTKSMFVLYSHASNRECDLEQSPSLSGSWYPQL